MNTSIQLKWGLSEAINYVKRVKMNELIKNWSVKQGVRIGIGPGYINRRWCGQLGQVGEHEEIVRESDFIQNSYSTEVKSVTLDLPNDIQN